MHGLILVPYYFFASLATLPFLMIICRLLRLKAAINTLAGIAIPVSLAGIVVPIVCHWLDLSALTGRPMLLCSGGRAPAAVANAVHATR
jgi:hypothetical protein